MEIAFFNHSEFIGFIGFGCFVAIGADEVARLCKALTLKDKEGSVLPLQIDLKRDGEKKMGFRLAGKLLSNKSVNRKAFINLFPCIWRTVEGFDIEVITENTFSFTFKSASDRWHVLQGGPWSFDRALLVLEEPQRKEEARVGETRSTFDDPEVGPSANTGRPDSTHVVSSSGRTEWTEGRDDMVAVETGTKVSIEVRGLGDRARSTDGRTDRRMDPCVIRKNLGIILNSDGLVNKAGLGLGGEMEVDAGFHTRIEHTRSDTVGLGTNQCGTKTGKWKRWASDGVRNNYGLETGSTTKLGKRLAVTEDMSSKKKQKKEICDVVMVTISEDLSAVNNDGRKRRLCLLWVDDTDITLLSYSKFHIDAKDLVPRMNPWRMTGDFSKILEDSEKKCGLQRPRSLIDNFRSAFDDCGLHDLGFSGPEFKWSNKRNGSDMVQERLDRYVCNSYWQNMFHLAKVSHLEFWKFDHRPILLDISPTSVPGNQQPRRTKRRFHIKKCSADEAECAGLIKKVWEATNVGHNMHELVSKISKCTDTLKV
ncbi:hypothetical protein Dsin_002687 [Dipteronia sinensis]|uniref:DUF4283 domain-containing protein n=1 Tax=Dipteronia sinensis TaxID=43782 RepID=A0AAE0B6N4_9ROSI|nr:hypothetical protein Dsin_002687 [Dipteronia sinensis]